MTQNQYEKLASDLQALARIVPLNWGGIQNDGTDNQINMFQIHSFQELERLTASLSENSRNYFRRRWFLWKSAQCDEHIFCMNYNVTPNPNFKDQSYDIEFNNNTSLRFDVKGTVIPRSFRENINEVILDPSAMVKFFYDEQSKGVRNNHQNRLFIVHHSYRAQEREMYLRCHWTLKKDIYKIYSEKINLSSNFINYQGVIADVIFIFENLDKSITHTFCSIK
jgi:hypothetical protein